MTEQDDDRSPSHPASQGDPGGAADTGRTSLDKPAENASDAEPHEVDTALERATAVIGEEEAEPRDG